MVPGAGEDGERIRSLEEAGAVEAGQGRASAAELATRWWEEAHGYR